MGPARGEKGVPVQKRRVVTMSDVAEAAGVSQSTVSRILNDTPLSIPVSAKTRERVLAVALEFGYRPHPIARALRGAPTMLLGAVVRDVTDLFFASAIEALSIEAREERLFGRPRACPRADRRSAGPRRGARGAPV